MTTTETVPAPTAAKSNTLPIGVFLVGSVVVVGLASTQIGGVVVAFLAAAAIYQGIKIIGGNKG